MTDKAADNTANEPAVRTDGKHTDSTADKYSYTASKKGLSVDYEKYTDRLILCMKMRMSFLLISLLVCCHKRQIKMTALW